ncbi:hypothetical protein P691DRAFT_801191 [Macrolepiota fuliginosa MF-IS2]|uniref:F-box domain-containing protein n=1 Tax=Macrolepiota fuliginosa MF-IS2 TaxID=1400762 RepID=A0A9P6C8X2_9AGAR|nr:hypothetical protein P691DRAFT_801191 [Macrolepiota fuliginosa MF-IS2]
METSESGPELPLELLPEILEHLPRANYLTRTALVNHTFHNATVPQLYARASIYSWHKEAKARVIQLFRTLASCPHLARYVRRLEIRDFPKNQLTDESRDAIYRGLRNCTNLRSCTWTRDGSLTTDILLALSHGLSDEFASSAFAYTDGGAPIEPRPVPTHSASVHSLRELEINGLSLLYDPRFLLRFEWLTKISIIMPSLEVTRILEKWVWVLGGRLKSLNLICKMSPLITDDVLIRMAPSLKNLEFLHLTGCPKVTHQGIRAVLAENEAGIMNLGLEGVSPRLDLAQLLPTSTTNQYILHNLRSLTLSIPPLHSTPSQITSTQSYPLPLRAPRISATPTENHTSTYGTTTTNLVPSHPGLTKYCSTLLTLLTHTDAGTAPSSSSSSSSTLSPPNLTHFQIYSPHMFFEPCSATRDLFRGLVDVHGGRLKRISVHRMLIGMDVIKEICARCIALEEFFVVIEPGGLDELADCIHLSKTLRTIHVNYPLEAHAEDGGIPVLRISEALQFVRRCAVSTLTQFGCNARVWHVNKRVYVTKGAGGEEAKECEVYLGPYESPDVPEQFLVVRT